MVTKYGMSEKLGSVCYAEEGEVFLGRDFQQRTNISDATARIIDEEIKAILDEGLQRAIDLLKEHESVLDEMAKVLLAKETIYSQEVNELIAGESAETVMKKMDEREAERKRKDKEAQEKKEAEKKAKLAQESKMNVDLENRVMSAFSGNNIKVEKKEDTSTKTTNSSNEANKSDTKTEESKSEAQNNKSTNQADKNENSGNEEK